MILKCWKIFCGAMARNWPPSSPSPSWRTWVASCRVKAISRRFAIWRIRFGAFFILDEVVTGFRYAPGGCQQHFGLSPDLSTFGKALGAGFPVGAVTGPRAILDRMRWGSDLVLHYGTFNGHRLTMSVIAANLDLLADNNNTAYQQIYAVGNAAIAGLRDIFHGKKIDAVVQGFGPMFQIYFTGREAIHDYRDYCQYVDTAKYSRFIHALLDRGIYMTPSNGLHWIISTAHTLAGRGDALAQPLTKSARRWHEHSGLPRRRADHIGDARGPATRQD